MSEESDDQSKFMEFVRLARKFGGHDLFLRAGALDSFRGALEEVNGLRRDLAEEREERSRQRSDLAGRGMGGGVSCLLARQYDANTPSMTEFLITPTGRTKTVKDLRGWVKGAKRVEIVDPYFMSGNHDTWVKSARSSYKHANPAATTATAATIATVPPDPAEKEYVDKHVQQAADVYAGELDEVLGGVKELIVFHLSGPPRSVETTVKRKLKEGRQCKWIPTEVMHDRVWIRDRNEARTVGTSFGGIGNKVAFMLPLPSEDLSGLRAGLSVLISGGDDEAAVAAVVKALDTRSS